jgi:hypothetical protein
MDITIAIGNPGIYRKIAFFEGFKDVVIHIIPHHVFRTRESSIFHTKSLQDLEGFPHFSPTNFKLFQGLLFGLITKQVA